MKNNALYRNRRIKVLIVGGGFLVGYIFCVGVFGRMPRCLFSFLSGYECPFCGVQRAFFRLVQGDFRGAFYLNPYVMVLAPYGVLVLYATQREKRIGRGYLGWVKHPVVVGGWVVIMVVWWIFRNTIFWQEILTQRGLV